MYRQHSLLLALPFLLLVAFFYFSNPNSEMGNNSSGHTVNAVIGDKSYIKFYGEKPDEDVPDRVRIRIHLQYVEQLLRERPTGHLSPDQRKNRMHYLDLLKEYYQAGEFPHNDGHPDLRRPVFIDPDGNICAVGYLVASSAGWKVADRINEQYKYASVFEIVNPVFEQWVKESGFTIRELAMIQPWYGTVKEVDKNRNRVGISYGIGSSLLASANTVYLSNGAHNPWLFSSPETNHWFGLATGTGSVMLGVLNLDNKQTYTESNACFNCTMYKIKESNHLRTGISIANIGVGAVNMVRSVYHLLSSTHPEPSKTKVALTHFQPGSVPAHEPAPALRFRIRF